MPLLKEVVTKHGTIRITKSDYDDSIKYHQDQTWQSANTLCGYIRSFISEIKEHKLKHVLMLGCGGGTLATIACQLGCEVTVVDICPESFMLARTFFDMPERVRCIEMDGVKHLKNTSFKYDCIIIDMYDNACRSIQLDDEAIKALNRILLANGRILINRLGNSAVIEKIQHVIDKERVLAA